MACLAHFISPWFPHFSNSHYTLCPSESTKPASTAGLGPFCAFTLLTHCHEPSEAAAAGGWCSDAETVYKKAGSFPVSTFSRNNSSRCFKPTAAWPKILSANALKRQKTLQRAEGVWRTVRVALLFPPLIDLLSFHLCQVSDLAGNGGAARKVSVIKAMFFFFSL